MLVYLVKYFTELVMQMVPPGYGTYFWGVIGCLLGGVLIVTSQPEGGVSMIVLSLQVMRQRRATAELEAAIKAQLNNQPPQPTGLLGD